MYDLILFLIKRFLLALKEILKCRNKRVIIQYIDERSFIIAFLIKIICGVLLKKNAILIGDDITLRYILFKSPLNHIVKAIEFFIVKYTDIITTSFRIDYEIMKQIRVGKPTYFIPNGIEIKHVVDIDIHAKNWKKILYISAHPGKRNNMALKTLLDIARIICRNIKGVKILIIGKYIPKFLRESNLVKSGCIELLGYVTSDKLKEIYKEVGIGLLPYFGEAAQSSQRIKTLEFFANGMLVVASKKDLLGIPGLRNYVHCIAVSTPEEMARELLNVLSKPSRYKHIALKGRSFIIKRYSWEEISKKYIDLIRKLLK